VVDAKGQSSATVWGGDSKVTSSSDAYSKNTAACPYPARMAEVGGCPRHRGYPDGGHRREAGAESPDTPPSYIILGR
jgi:hypothetical protein